ncbi:trigger factor [Gammaproteobacteria bacterium]|nr:trigger factor [Gammaproteobacteria bacterium]
MTSKLKKLKDLNRKLTVSVDTKKYDEKYQAKLNKIKSTVKLDGFRKGKVPNDVLIQKYGPSIHYEVLNEVIQETYPLEIAEKEIKPASSPKISIDSEDPKKGIVYSAEFEVFPKFKPKLTRWKSFEESKITIESDDIDLAITDILERYGTWEDVDRAALEKDQVIIDFTGTVDGEDFEGNSSKDFALVIGSKSMIPGFEDAIIGKKISDEFKAEVKFPDDYFKSDLAGKNACFLIKVNKVQEKQNAPINEELYKSLGMEEVKNEQDFKVEIEKRMQHEVKQQEDSLTRESIYDLLLELNKFSAPSSVINEQATLMRKDSLMRMGQQADEAPEDLFPLDTFLENAEKRVKLDLLFSEFVKFFKLEVNQEKIDEFVENEAEKYKDPDQFKTWIKSQPKQLDNYKMIILEELLIEKLKNELKSRVKEIKFKDLANIK